MKFSVEISADFEPAVESPRDLLEMQDVVPRGAVAGAVEVELVPAQTWSHS